MLCLCAVARSVRVAVVFAGHARTFAKPAVHGSILRHLVRPLRENGEAAVFWLFSEAPGWSPRVRARLEELFQPAAQAVAILPEEGLGGEWHAPCLAPRPPDLSGVPPTYKFFAEPREALRTARALFARLRAGFELVLFEERRSGRRFDWVVRARFDAAWYGPAPALRLVEPPSRRAARAYVPGLTWNGVNDQFAVVPRVLADDFFDVGAFLLECAASGGPRWAVPARVWQPETVLFSHLEARAVPFGRVTVPAVVHRADGDTRCTDLMPYALLGTVVDALARGPAAFSAIAKTAHLGACAAHFACCRLDLDGRAATVNAHAARQAAADLCRGGGCDADSLYAALRNVLAAADDEALLADLAALDEAEAASSRCPQGQGAVVVQINSRTEEVRSPGRAARLAAYSTHVVARYEDAHRLWRLLRCDYLERLPRAEALYHAFEYPSGPPRGCPEAVAAAEALLSAEANLDALLDQAGLTDPTYASLQAGNAAGLGWHVWALPGAEPRDDMPHFLLSDDLLGEIEEGKDPAACESGGAL